MPRARPKTIPPTMPGFLPPVEAVAADRPPTDARWAYEVKWDGYRLQAHKAGDQVRVYTRSGNDWTARFAPIVAALGELPARQAILDGEAVTIDQRGVADFHPLRREVGKPAG